MLISQTAVPIKHSKMLAVIGACVQSNEHFIGLVKDSQEFFLAIVITMYPLNAQLSFIPS